MKPPITSGGPLDRPRVALAACPTPLQRLVRTGLPVELWMKRDDRTGSTLSGNKVRKLEFLLADALAQGADLVLTCGGDQSNHCRATAVAARELGLDSLLFLRTEHPANPPAATGNLLLDRVVGAEVRFISRPDYGRRRELMGAAAEALRAAGRRPYVIPEGGSNALGSLGYVACIDELAVQVEHPDRPLTIVYAAGSGGTGAGLVSGVMARELPWRVVGVNVCDNREYFVDAIGDIVDELRSGHGMSFDFDRQTLEIVDGFVGRGYAKTRPEELAALVALGRAEGVVLDPVYTGKAWFGFTETLRIDPQAFGPRVVFLHSGGIYGLLAQADALQPLL